MNMKLVENIIFLIEFTGLEHIIIHLLEHWNVC